MVEQLGLSFAGVRAPREIMISLHEKWHSAILAGEKKFEFRRTFINEPCTAYVYVSGRIRGVAAVAELAAPIAGSPAEVVERVSSGATAESLRAYYGQRTRVYAIPISRYELIPVVSLDDLRRAQPRFQPPQSYIFIDRNPTVMTLLHAVKSRSGPTQKR